MADRSVVVRLRAQIGEYQTAMSQATASTKNLGRTISQSSRDNQEEFKKLGFVAVGAAAAIGAGIGGAIKVAADFEKQMSGVAAVSGASASELDKLADAAIAAGASTKLAGVSASEAAAAEAELVKAGVSVNDILGGALIGSLSLASAGQLEFADAATIAAQAMNIFDLNGRDVEHVADVLAAAANKSATDVKGLGDALRQGGLVAEQTGLSLEETVGALAAFGDSALIGSDAGTSLKTMLQRLTPQSDAAAAKMEELGFNAYDAQGNFIGLEGLSGELADSFGGLDAESRNAAMGIVFGSDAIRGANVLMAQGAEGISEYVDAVNDQGAAARMAAAQMDNLSGDVETLGGAFETVLIQSGSKANGVMRELVQTTTDVVSGFGALPDGVQGAGMAIGGVSAAGLGLIGTAGILLPKIREVQSALQLMGTAGKFASSMIGPGFAAGGILVVGMGLLAAATGAAQRKAQELVDTLNADVDLRSISSIGDAMERTREEIARLDAEWDAHAGGVPGPLKGLERGFQNVKEVLSPLENEILDNKEATAALYDEMERLTRTGMNLEGNLLELQNRLGLTEDEVVTLADKVGVDLTSSFSEVVPVLEAAHGQLSLGTPAANEMAGAMDVLGSSVADTEEKMDAFNDLLDSVLGHAFNVEQATDDLTVKIMELGESFALNSEGVAGNTATLDANTEAGLANRAVARDMVDGVFELVRAQAEHGASSEDLQATLEYERARLQDVFEQLGFNSEEVAAYTDVLNEVPLDIGTNVTADTSAARAAVDAYRRDVLDQLPRQITTHLSVVGIGGADAQRITQNLQDTGLLGSLAGRASGGPVTAGAMYEVNERGPEVLQVGGRSLLMMGAQSGNVMPYGSSVTNNAIGGASSTQNVTVKVSAPAGSDVAAQSALGARYAGWLLSPSGRS